MDLNDLSLFQQDSLDNIIQNDDYFHENESRMESARLKSTSNAATYKKLIDLVSKIVDLTNESRERPITFMSYSSYKKSQDIDVPIVTYRTIHRVPQKEVKPRFRETVNDINNENKAVDVYGQKFEYGLEFTIIDSSDEFAEDTMYEIEDLMLQYAGYFMSQGVSNIRFLEQSQDTSIVMGEDFFTKTILYSVILERITLVSEDKIRKIISRISTD